MVVQQRGEHRQQLFADGDLQRLNAALGVVERDVVALLLSSAAVSGDAGGLGHLAFMSLIAAAPSCISRLPTFMASLPNRVCR